MEELKLRQLKAEFLNKHLFQHLKNLNDSFDVPSIAYFDEAAFETVLQRIKALRLGVYGIEPWLNGEYYSTLTFEDSTNDPTDPTWYFSAFEKFKAKGLPLQYSATYHVPEEMLVNF